MPRRCPRGEILREGYHRRAYTRTDGTAVAAAEVPATCVPDRGAPGKADPADRITWDDQIVLSEYGYSVHRLAAERREALEAAVERWGSGPVMQNLNAKRNINPQGSRVHRIMSSDVQWLKRYRTREQSGGEDLPTSVMYEDGQHRLRWLTGLSAADLGPVEERDPDLMIHLRRDTGLHDLLIYTVAGETVALFLASTDARRSGIWWSWCPEGPDGRLLWMVEQAAESRGRVLEWVYLSPGMGQDREWINLLVGEGYVPQGSEKTLVLSRR